MFCTLTCTFSFVYLAKCEERAVRLFNTRSGRPSYGRIEACIDGEWKTVCRDHINDNDASVVCRQLGYSPYGMHVTIM